MSNQQEFHIDLRQRPPGETRKSFLLRSLKSAKAMSKAFNNCPIHLTGYLYLTDIKYLQEFYPYISSLSFYRVDGHYNVEMYVEGKKRK